MKFNINHIKGINSIKLVDKYFKNLMQAYKTV